MKRFCVICGKELDIILGNLDRHTKRFEIISGGYYFNLFGKMNNINIKTVDEQTEYWECEECYNE